MSDNNHSKLKRKIAIYTLIFVLAGAAARIAYVNITAEKPIICLLYTSDAADD